MSRRAGDTLACMAVCPPGVEPLLDAELAALGIARRNVVRGGVEVNLRPRQLYAANLWLRTATRVLLRVATFDVHDFATLERNAATVNWRQWVPAGAQVTFRVSSHRSRLDHTRAIAERLAAAAGAPLATGTADWADGGSSYDDEGAPPAGPPAARFVARIDRNRLTLSADSSGEVGAVRWPRLPCGPHWPPPCWQRWAGQHRANQNRANQNRANQNRACQHRADPLRVGSCWWIPSAGRAPWPLRRH